jgi:hypothetical protein
VAAEERAGHSRFTSVLTFAGVHDALTSKLNDKSRCPIAFAQAKQTFAMDWENQLAVIELGANILSFVPAIFERTVLTSSACGAIGASRSCMQPGDIQSSDASAP